MKKTLLILLVAALAAGGAFYYLHAHHKTAPTAGPMLFDPEAPVSVIVARPAIQRIEHTLNTVGTFLAEDKVAVSPTISGPVAEILVEEGQRVEKGDVLMRIDDTRFRFQYERAVADVTQREADVASQQANFERQAKLAQSRLIAAADFDQAKTSQRLAEAQLVAAKAALALEAKSLNDIAVTSPLDGVVSARKISKGEYAQIGTAVYEIVSTTPLKLRFTLPERYAGSVRIGQKVELTVRATGDRKFAGEIYFINPTVNPDALTLEVKALVENWEDALKPGYFAQVALTTGVNERAVMIPQDALVIRGNEQVVFVVKDGHAELRQLRLGERRDTLIEVLEGVTAEEPVIISGQFQLADGKAVTIVTDSARAGGPRTASR